MNPGNNWTTLWATLSSDATLIISRQLLALKAKICKWTFVIIGWLSELLPICGSYSTRLNLELLFVDTHHYSTRNALQQRNKNNQINCKLWNYYFFQPTNEPLNSKCFPCPFYNVWFQRWTITYKLKTKCYCTIWMSWTMQHVKVLSATNNWGRQDSSKPNSDLWVSKKDADLFDEKRIGKPGLQKFLVLNTTRNKYKWETVGLIYILYFLVGEALETLEGIYQQFV